MIKFEYLNENYLPIYLIIIMINISFHTYFFINALLFSDKYISERNAYENIKEIEYIITKEYERIILVFFLSLLIKRRNIKK